MTSASRKKWIRIGAGVAGIVLGIVCHHVPPQYQAACNAVTQIASLSCGAGAP